MSSHDQASSDTSGSGIHRTIGRTMLVHVAGGIGVGAAAGYPIPPLTTVFAAFVGAVAGAVAGLLASVEIFETHRQNLPYRFAELRRIVIVPAMAIVGLSTLISLALLIQSIVYPSALSFGHLMMVSFGLPILLTPAPIRAAAAWCLAPRFAQTRSQVNGLRMLRACAPILAAAILLPAIMLFVPALQHW